MHNKVLARLNSDFGSPDRFSGTLLRGSGLDRIAIPGACGIAAFQLVANPMLAWSEEFSTGYALVDTQHRMLIDKINLLEQLLNGPPPPKQKCDELLSFLGSYVGTHFKFEEQCMEKAKCPVHEKNKQAHAAFLGVFAKFKEKYAVEGPKPELLKSLQTAAADWIRNHILSVDRELRKCKV